MHTPPNPDPAPRRPAESPGDPDAAQPSLSTASHPTGKNPGANAPGSPGVDTPDSSTVPLLGSSAVRLRPAPPENTDDAPTIITGNRAGRPAAPPIVAAGQKLGHFELIEAIGAGGMATVLKARDLELGRTVALKLLPPETARDAEAVTRFKQEARAAAKLDHDNVARVYFCGEDQGQHFIAFEFVEGENLRQLIDRRGTLPPADCVRYMLQVSAGLAHAAERGVVHRDVKPSNILVTPDGKAKIVDMGLARHLESHSINGGLTQSGVTLGTFDYISPEQALDPRRADVRSDIYSLGCTFYHALTGRPPVPEGTAAKKLQAHQHEQPLDPRAINPQVPDALAVVLSKMMAKDPDRRYQTPGELSRDLVALARDWGMTVDAVSSDAAAPAAPPVVPDPPRLPVGWLAVGSVLAVALAVFIGATGRNDPAPPAPWGEPGGRANNGVAERARTGEGEKNLLSSPPPSLPPSPRPVVDARAFAAAVKAGEKTIQLRKGRGYDLSTLLEPVVFTGEELTIEAVADPDDSPANANRPPLLRVAAAPIGEEDALHGGTFSIRGAKWVAFKGVTIEVTARGDADPVETGLPVGLWIADASRVEFDGCRFQLDAQAAGERLAGLAVTASSARRTELAISHALFNLGPQGVGLRLAGPVAAAIREAAFAPHEAAILVGPGPAGDLSLHESTFMLDPTSAAVEAGTGAKFQVAAGHCVFAAATAPPPGAGMPGGGVADVRPAVLRIAADGVSAAGSRFTARPGEPNAYYRTAALAAGGRNYSFDECKDLGPPPPAADSGAVVLTARPPWDRANPRGALAAERPEYAFRLNLGERKLRTEGPVHVLGAKEVARAGDRIYNDKPFPPERPRPPVQAKAGERVYYPDADPADAPHRLHGDFLIAFDKLQPGETLLVAANGPVPVPPLPAEKPNLSAIIKPYPGYAPELVPGGQSRLRDAGLFRLTDGELTFENLAITLSARQSVVAVSGGRAVTFRQCVVTLDERDGDPQAAVAVADPAREMRMSPAEFPLPPRVTFENTLVRGKGRAVWVQAARPFDLIAENSAFALDGPFLDVGAPAKDLPASLPTATVRLTRVTAILNGPLLAVDAPRGPAGRVVPVAMEADRCLFAPASAARSRPLIVVENADPLAEPKKYLSWQTSRANVYANYGRLTTVLELRPAAEDGSPPLTWDLDRWAEFARDAGPGVGLAVKFAGGPIRNRLAAVKPADLRAEPADPDGPVAEAGAAGDLGPVAEK